MTTNNKVLSSEQLNLFTKLRAMNIATQPQVVTKSELLPQLSQLIKHLENDTFDIFLLASPYPVDKYLSWLNCPAKSMRQSSVDHIIGYFETSLNGKVNFCAGTLFNNEAKQTGSFILSANHLLQDAKLLDLVGKIILNKVFNTRWLLPDDNQIAQQASYRHKQLRFNKKIIITGDYEALLNLKYLLPSLVDLTADEIIEADYIAELKPTAILAFHDFINYELKQKTTDEQLESLLWALARAVEEQSWFSLDLTLLKRLLSRLPQHFKQADVEIAIQDINGFNSASRLFNFEQILKNTIKVDFSGEVVGQINGLTVVESALAEFGEPSRITANIFVGEGDIGDIERKSELGGNIHAKAMMILSSFVSRVFAKNEPLPISSNIVFEQSYHEVDGDSASLAELYALLSAISNIPIRQNVALTGAIDQLGNVLAVGGLDLKIEGYYVLAKLKAPMETHHIIIPEANVTHLNLSSEILNAVHQGSLQIHAIKHVTQASEILTGLPAESENGDSLFDKVRLELEHFGQELEHSRSIFRKIAFFFTKST